MCGLAGFAGRGDAVALLLQILQRLEYRGYDSAGLAVISPEGDVQVCKRKGEVKHLAQALESYPLSGTVGLAHTRWATHGDTRERNAHPHLDCSGRLALVHNGVVANAASLRAELLSRGHKLASETDSELLAHRLEELVAEGAPLHEALAHLMEELHGSAALCVLSAERPDVVYGAVKDLPLLVFQTETGHLLCSDPHAAIGARSVYALQSKEVCAITADRARLWRKGAFVPVPFAKLAKLDAPVLSKTSEPRMLLEIKQQPQVLKATLQQLESGAALSKDLHPFLKSLARTPRVVVAACGSACHAGLVAKHLVEPHLAQQWLVRPASELLNNLPKAFHGAPVLAVSQSGETADTLNLVQHLKRQGHPVLSICNVAASTLMRETEYNLLTPAGPELSVASTKAFSAQVAALLWLVLKVAEKRGEGAFAKSLRDGLKEAPCVVSAVLGSSALADLAAKRYLEQAQSVLFLGRGPDYALAREGALKLKEITYLPAEGLPTGELKHGALALVSERAPAVVLMHGLEAARRTLVNCEEIAARGAPVLPVAAGKALLEAQERFDLVLPVASTTLVGWCFGAATWLQLLACSTALHLKRNVDRPRHLAKSVTVE